MNVVWLEGVLDFFNAPFPYDDRNDPRRIGFGVGQQTVGLYLTEMLLKYALDHVGMSYDQHHNLHRLFTDLPESHRRAVEQKYTEILNSEAELAWDIAETADSLLTYWGQNAITDTRYFWEPDHNHVGEEASILFAPSMLRPLIYGIFIVLHNYPTKPIVKRYDTTYQSLAESFKKDQQHAQSDPASRGAADGVRWLLRRFWGPCSPPPCAPCRSCRPVRVRPPPSGTYGRRCSRRKRCSTPRCGPNWRTIPSWGKRELIRRYVRNALRRSRRVRKRGRAAARGLQDVSGVWRDVAMGLCRRMRRGRSRSECIANVPDCVRSPSRGSLIRQHRRASTMTDPWRRRSLGAASLFAGVRCCCDWETRDGGGLLRQKRADYPVKPLRRQSRREFLRG